ncbi:diguanylate cyclase [Ideonella sp. B508-1]|uniref:sensor domain-containing diguanylate cyclase n=1 Tax=Ideonella sp. B508-1 TaxID=137716 RepID=UPI00047608CB|nr:diguanylate cyclase [Ideonella sp. B508-1]
MPITVVMLTQPVIRQGEIRAVLGGVLRLNQDGLMREVSEAGLDLGEGAISQLLAVTDGQGRHLVDGVIDEEQIGAEARQDLALAMAHWRDQGSPVEPEGVIWTGQKQIVVAAGVPGADWVVWRRYSRDTLLEPLNAMRSRSLHWSLGLWGGLSLLLLLYLGWQLHPLALLERRVVGMLDGGQDPHAGWPRARGEIGALSATLSGVALALADKQAENQRLLEQRESLMAAAPLGLAFVREDRLTLVNAELERLLGYAPQELKGLPVQLLMADPEESARMASEMRAALTEGRAYEGEHRFLRRQGSTFWGQVHARQVRAGQPEAGVVWTLGDITTQVASRHQLEWSATHDPLTGLLNRRGFEDRMERFVEGRLRRPAALLIIDLDHFKPINDSAGHQAGDAMLQAIARGLNEGVRASDAVGRLGGDEFAVLLEGCPPQWARRLAQKLLERIRAVQVPWNGRQLQVSASIGLAMWNDSMGSSHHWIHAADLACYEAKRAGRANVQASADEPLDEALG